MVLDDYAGRGPAQAALGGEIWVVAGHTGMIFAA